MMNDDEPGTVKLPRPAPISSSNDFAMPKFATFGFCVRSGIWALADKPYRTVMNPAATKRNKNAAIFNLDKCFMTSPLEFESSLFTFFMVITPVRLLAG